MNYIKEVVGAFDGENEVIAAISLEFIDVKCGMGEAALFSNDGAFLGEQIMHYEVFRRVVNDFFVVECEVCRAAHLLPVYAQNAFELHVAASAKALLQSNYFLSGMGGTLLWLWT